MKTTRINIVDAFIIKARNRIWLQNIASSIFRSLWLSSIILLVCGTVHIFIIHVEWIYALLLTVTPTFLYLIHALIFTRPSIQFTTISIDHEFKSNSLLTTAREIIDKGEYPNAASFIIDNAILSIKTWINKLESTYRIHVPVISIIPVSILLASAFLLLLPHVERPSSNTVHKDQLSVPADFPTQSVLADKLKQQLIAEKIIMQDKTTGHLTKSENTSIALRPGNNSKSDNIDTEHHLTSLIINDRPVVESAYAPDMDTFSNYTGTQTEITRQGTHSNSPGSGKDENTAHKIISKSEMLEIEFINILDNSSVNKNSAVSGGERVELERGVSSNVKNVPYPYTGNANSGKVSLPYRMVLTPEQKKYLVEYFRLIGDE